MLNRSPECPTDCCAKRHRESSSRRGTTAAWQQCRPPAARGSRPFEKKHDFTCTYTRTDTHTRTDTRSQKQRTQTNRGAQSEGERDTHARTTCVVCRAHRLCQGKPFHRGQQQRTDAQGNEGTDRFILLRASSWWLQAFLVHDVGRP